MSNKRLNRKERYHLSYIVAAVMLVSCSVAGLILHHFSLNLTKWNLLSGLIIMFVVDGFVGLCYKDRMFEWRKGKYFPLTLQTIIYSHLFALVGVLLLSLVYMVFCEIDYIPTSLWKLVLDLPELSRKIPIINLGFLLGTLILTLLKIVNECMHMSITDIVKELLHK